MNRRVLLTAGVLVAVWTVGCGKKPPPIVEVEGRVTLRGQPLPKAEVRFYPMTGFGGEYIAVGETDEEGRFKLSCLGQPGACACENRVTVTEAPVPAEMRGLSGEAQARVARYRAGLKNRPIPDRYANLAQSPLKVTVTADKKEYNIELPH
jgi:hypothetical protein